MGTVSQRVEKHVIRQSHPHYALLKDFCHRSKNLYNHACYEVRQAYFKEGKWLRYATLEKILKADREFPDYAAMPAAQCAQQTLRLLDSCWKSWFSSIRDFGLHPEKYRGKPRIPGYLKKDGFYPLVLTNQNCRLKEGILHFPKAFKDFTVTPVFHKRDDYLSFQQVRMIPHKDRIVVELVFRVRIPARKGDGCRCAGIDIGVNNLAAVCNNAGLPAFSINGRPLKSINQYYNRKAAGYRKILKRVNKRDYSRRMDALTQKRGRKMEDYLHKASRRIVDFCAENDIGTIVIGKNDGWKQGSPLSKKNNRHFVQIPFARFIGMIRYKAEEKGIAVILTEESYTSGTSFIDDEPPAKEFYNRARRIHRGLFRSENGTLINADLNGAYQILKKAVPMKWDGGCGLHPIVINVA